ncbi:hypothetical protein MUK42_21477 [Musa troglodytarum]|uniref:Uncharacterized protein n=1 Tax=Musa troglodytarum TaxID=320322 RepID=A0A9E7G5A9_9LILI|nr:hypothetical protein MUK42_21477 [Musa troglodytarum]
MLLSFAFVALSQKASPCIFSGTRKALPVCMGMTIAVSSSFLTPRVGNTRGATTSWWRSHIYEPQTSCSASNEQLPHEQKQCETTVTVRR